MNEIAPLSDHDCRDWRHHLEFAFDHINETWRFQKPQLGGPVNVKPDWKAVAAGTELLDDKTTERGLKLYLHDITPMGEEIQNPYWDSDPEWASMECTIVKIHKIEKKPKVPVFEEVGMVNGETLYRRIMQ